MWFYLLLKISSIPQKEHFNAGSEARISVINQMLNKFNSLILKKEGKKGAMFSTS